MESNNAKTKAEKTAETIDQRRKGHGEAIRDAVFSHYIETKKAMTIKEIAEAMAMKESWVRRYIHDSRPGKGGMVPDGIAFSDDYRATYSKDYPDMQTGMCKVTVYEPTKDYIVERYKQIVIEMGIKTVNGDPTMGEEVI